MRRLLPAIGSFLMLAGLSAVARETALWLDAQNGHAEVVGLLLSKGATADAKNPSKRGATPLMIAAEQGRLKVVMHLVEGGADVNAKPSNGLTPLIAASYKGHAEIVKLLLARGADATASLTSGGTALTMAEKGRRTEVVRILKARLAR